MVLRAKWTPAGHTGWRRRTLIWSDRRASMCRSSMAGQITIDSSIHLWCIQPLTMLNSSVFSVEMSSELNIAVSDYFWAGAKKSNPRWILVWLGQNPHLTGSCEGLDRVKAYNYFLLPRDCPMVCHFLWGERPIFWPISRCSRWDQTQ